jgi:hypothetical protein
MLIFPAFPDSGGINPGIVFLAILQRFLCRRKTRILAIPLSTSLVPYQFNCSNGMHCIAPGTKIFQLLHGAKINLLTIRQHHDNFLCHHYTTSSTKTIILHHPQPHCHIPHDDPADWFGPTCCFLEIWHNFCHGDLVTWWPPSWDMG